MKLRWKITMTFAVAGVIAALFLLRPGSAAQTEVAKTRLALRQQGFKTDLTDFNLGAPGEDRARVAALSDIRSARQAVFMREVGSNAAMVVWKQGQVEEDAPGQQSLPTLEETINKNEEALDAACEAALSGPIRFDLNASAGSAMRLGHLVILRNLTQMLGARAMLDLDQEKKDAAWTNLLAATRLISAWDIEPCEVSHLVQCACSENLFNITWQLLQADGWTDDRLARLQQEWESLDFFTGLPEVAAFSRASTVALCQLERGRPAPVTTLKDMVRSPRYAWSSLNDNWRQFRYRHLGTYEDEKALLLFYRDRELELRRAVRSATWAEMRQLPGVTNMPVFQSKYPSMMQVMMNSRQLSVRFQAQGRGPLARAAEAEARRRIIVTALALERYLGRHGSYPKALPELAPEFLKSPPGDFMDGKPLRYRLTGDGHFILYSVGLDCVDDGGNMQPTVQFGRRAGFYGGPGGLGFGFAQGFDLVWPRPASPEEVKAQQEVEKTALEDERKMAELRAETTAREQEASRQATVKRLLTMKQPPRGKEAVYNGRPLSQVLRNEGPSGKASLDLDGLLTARQVVTGEEPEVATFEVPIAYDVVTNIGELRLLVDAEPEARSASDLGELQSCSRSTNGNCLLAWNTTYDPPGQHAVQAQLYYADRGPGQGEIRGPVTPFFSSNLCQFNAVYSQFDSRGGILYAKLPESNGLYSIELKAPTGEHIRTFKGSTSNGVIQVPWDLTDDHGKKCTNESVDTVFQITLPDSKRSQTLKGP